MLSEIRPLQTFSLCSSKGYRKAANLSSFLLLLQSILNCLHFKWPSCRFKIKYRTFVLIIPGHAGGQGYETHPPLDSRSHCSNVPTLCSRTPPPTPSPQNSRGPCPAMALIFKPLSRYIAIIYPLRANSEFARRGHFMLAAAWVASALCSLPQAFMWDTRQEHRGFSDCSKILGFFCI